MKRAFTEGLYWQYEYPWASLFYCRMGDNNALIFMKTPKKDSPLRHSLQEHHLCKLLSALPQRMPTPTHHRTLSRPCPPAPFHDQPSRKERIKFKIKSKLREGLDLLLSREPPRSPADIQLPKRQQRLLSRSEFMLVRQPAKQKDLDSMLANCVIEPITLHKTIPRRPNRSRALNSVLQMRTHAQSVMKERSTPPPRKHSVQRIGNQPLQPWRYLQQIDEMGL